MIPHGARAIRERVFFSLFLSGVAIVAAAILRAQVPLPDPPKPLASLKTVPVPEPADLARFVGERRS